MQTHAILFTGVDSVATAQVDVPEPGEGEVLIETAFSCISPGTELRCLAGKQAGAANWPYVPGYSASGKIIAAGPGTSLPAGTTVFCKGTAKASERLNWGGHVGHAVCPEGDVLPVPDGVDLVEASMVHLIAIAWRGVRLSASQSGEIVAVVGLGPIGMLSARLHRVQGARVLAADLSSERVALAQSAGIDAFVPDGDLAMAFRKRLPDPPHVVVDSTGAPAVFTNLVRIAEMPAWNDDSAAPGARFIVQGSYPDEFSVPYQEAFRRELSIWFPRDIQPRDLREAIDLLGKKAISVRDIVGEIKPPEEAANVYRSLQDAKGGVLTAAFAWK